MYFSDSKSALVTRSIFVDYFSSDEIFPKYFICIAPASLANSLANSKKFDGLFNYLYVLNSPA